MKKFTKFCNTENTEERTFRQCALVRIWRNASPHVSVFPGLPIPSFRISEGCDPLEEPAASLVSREPEVAEERKVSIDKSCAVRGRVGFRAAWPSRIIDSSEHTQSLAFGTASRHRRREWKTRHATISRCDLMTRCRMAWSVIKIELPSARIIKHAYV